MIDLSQFGTSVDLYLHRLPSQFSDLFLEDFKGKELLGDQENLSIYRCLKCGKFVGGDLQRHVYLHATECHFGLFLCIAGPGATCVMRVYRANQPQGGVKPIRPLYVTEFGDEDVGLKFGAQLVLSPERRDVMKRDVAIGLYSIEGDGGFGIVGVS